MSASLELEGLHIKSKKLISNIEKKLQQAVRQEWNDVKSFLPIVFLFLAWELLHFTAERLCGHETFPFISALDRQLLHNLLATIYYKWSKCNDEL